MSTLFFESSPDVDLLIQGRHYNPHAFLGLHTTSSNGQIIRLWRPSAQELCLEYKGRIVSAQKVNEEGVFEYVCSEPTSKTDYRVYHHSGVLTHDPYAFWPQVGEVDTFLFNQGCHYDLSNVLGAQLKTVDGVVGTAFSVWAPNASSVSLVGDFNHFDGRVNPMRSLGASGIWELFVPGVGEGEKYKFEIRTREGYIRVKSDPMAFYAEKRPKNASVVFDVRKHEWKDGAWMERRWARASAILMQYGSPQDRSNLDSSEPPKNSPNLTGRGINTPLNIYEIHLASWRNLSSDFPTYRNLARDLAKYCKEMGFTHVELLPVMEHPLDESWGYQVTGFFAATSRYGTPEDFQFFVDHLHQEGIGVIVDWVPAHFPTDDFSLNRFDGTALYEHDDPRKGMHPHWQTAIFNYGRKEVSNFLIASALFWIEKMHVDGLRVDAVASMLYLDYGRKEGEWIPNPYGGNFNLEAIEFLKHLNSIVRQRHPDVLMIAEESSAYAGVSHPEGLGFDLKWNMGWMNDTLRYFSRDPVYRCHHQQDLTFSLIYAFSEKFLLVFSHDEVVHGKGSLIGKMPGTDWQQFAGVRLLYSYMMCHPGKKLLFMGGELGQRSEWNSEKELDWYLLQYDSHRGLSDCIRELNHFYQAHPALWERDFDWRGFEWIDFSDAQNSVICYFRRGEHAQLVCVHNFTPEFRSDYLVRLNNLKGVQEVFNTDAARFGGSDQLNREIGISGEGFRINLAPLATMIFEVSF